MRRDTVLIQIVARLAARLTRHTKVGRQLARERLDLNRELWGERPEGDPGGLSLRGPPIAP
jgi:hypothetical protein